MPASLLPRLLVGLLLAAWPTLALADDWQADRLRGTVLQLVDGDWQKLQRGDVVPDSRVIRTLANGNVEFTRGQETLTVGPDTQIQIFDQGGARAFTTVKQYFGTVAVEAEVRNVQHFAVQTPYLAAVVKGTRFVVVSNSASSSVAVSRGHVAVETRGHQRVTIGAGQSTAVASGKAGEQPMVVTGVGALPPVTRGNGDPPSVAPDPALADPSGPVPPVDADKALRDAEKAAKDAEKAAEKAAKEADKAAQQAAKDAEKAAKDAEKAAKDAAKAAEKAAKDAQKAASDAAKPNKGGKGKN